MPYYSSVAAKRWVPSDRASTEVHAAARLGKHRAPRAAAGYKRSSVALVSTALPPDGIGNRNIERPREIHPLGSKRRRDIPGRQAQQRPPRNRHQPLSDIRGADKSVLNQGTAVCLNSLGFDQLGQGERSRPGVLGQMLNQTLPICGRALLGQESLATQVFYIHLETNETRRHRLQEHRISLSG